MEFSARSRYVALNRNLSTFVSKGITAILLIPSKETRFESFTRREPSYFIALHSFGHPGLFWTAVVYGTLVSRVSSSQVKLSVHSQRASPTLAGFQRSLYTSKKSVPFYAGEQ